MADTYSLSIIAEMDNLWFHQIILFSQPTITPFVAKHVEKHVSISESSSSSSSSSSSILSLTPLLDEETSTDESLSPQKQASSESIISLPIQVGSIENKEEIKEILNKLSNLNSSHLSGSSLPTTRNRSEISRKKDKLQKTMSCRTLGELELDEVKGFMDLGFIFKKEYISPRMISVVPGLQRLCSFQDNKKNHAGLQIIDDATENNDDIIVEVYEDEKRDIMRPYLSEAWLIKKPDSPLLSMKVPKTCSADNMKKHLRVWAKTVASEVKQE